MAEYPNTELQRHLAKISACHAARRWAGKPTPNQAWEECRNPSWLMWWATWAGHGVNDSLSISKADEIDTQRYLGQITAKATCTAIRKILKCPYRRIRKV